MNMVFPDSWLPARMTLKVFLDDVIRCPITPMTNFTCRSQLIATAVKRSWCDPANTLTVAVSKMFLQGESHGTAVFGSHMTTLSAVNN
jgi:hypothetical protein